jgi:hypothetical protein
VVEVVLEFGVVVAEAIEGLAADRRGGVGGEAKGLGDVVIGGVVMDEAGHAEGGEAEDARATGQLDELVGQRLGEGVVVNVGCWQVVGHG